MTDAAAIIGMIGGAVGILSGGGLIGLWRAWRQEHREEHQAFFASYEKSIATLEKQYQRETDPAKKEKKRQLLETVENEYLEQQEAYRQNRALRQTAPRGVVVAGRPPLPQLVLAALSDQLEKAQPLSPALLTAQDYFLRGNALQNLERYEEALANYNRALELAPDDPDTLGNRGAILGELERYEEALADFNRSLELRPHDPHTLYNRGTAFGHLERYEEALADFNRSLELRPGEPYTLVNRGIALRYLRRYDEALADCNRAVELGPDDPYTLNGRGAILAHLQRYEEALADFNRSLEVRPDNGRTMYNIACLYSLWGRYDESLEWLKKAITRDAKYRVKAADDEDFAGLRADPEFGPQFQKLTGEQTS